MNAILFKSIFIIDVQLKYYLNIILTNWIKGVVVHKYWGEWTLLVRMLWILRKTSKIHSINILCYSPIYCVSWCSYVNNTIYWWNHILIHLSIWSCKYSTLFVEDGKRSEIKFSVIIMFYIKLEKLKWKVCYLIRSIFQVGSYDNDVTSIRTISKNWDI